MKKLMMLFALLALAVLGSGCAALSALPVASMLGSPNSSALEIHNSTDVRLQAANFILIKPYVVGQSKGFSLLGILTIVPADYTKAMERLYKQAEVQPCRSQTLANLNMEKNSTYLILFSIPKISICADLIEFLPATNSPPTPLKSNFVQPQDGAFRFD